MAASLAGAGQQLADVHDALEVVECVPPHRVAAVGRVQDLVQGGAGGQSGVEPADVERGDHDVRGLAVGEVEDVVQQLLLCAREHPGALHFLDQGVQLGRAADRLARHDLVDPERSQQHAG